MSENTIVCATARCGRTTSAGDCYNADHNSRDSGIGSHVNREEMKRNRYIVWDGDGARDKKSEESFDAHERAQYKRLFGKSLDAQNDRYRARRQECRCLTIDQYRRRARSCPEELILQIGDASDAVSRADLRRAANDFLNQFVKQFGSSVVPLDIALHFDESSNHAHFRYVYTAEGKDGLEVSQKRALAALGIQRPNPDAEETRHNNAKMTFTAQLREMWIIAIERSTEYEVNRVPKTPGRAYVEPATYRAEKALTETTSEVIEMRAERDSLASEVKSLRQEKKRLIGLVAPLRAALDRVGVLFRAFADNPHVARIKSAVDALMKAYDDVECDEHDIEYDEI